MSVAYCRTNKIRAKMAENFQRERYFFHPLKEPPIWVQLSHQKKTMVTLLSNWYGLGYPTNFYQKRKTNIRQKRGSFRRQ